MKISAEEFNRLITGIARTVVILTHAFTHEEPSTDYVQEITRKLTCDYLDELGIAEVEEA